MIEWVQMYGGQVPAEAQRFTDAVAASGGAPLLVAAHDLLRRSLMLYGLGGLVLPFVGIKLIDLLISGVPGLGQGPVKQKSAHVRGA
jgi:high-affinity K+ transport system ATPase subunit B